MNGKLAEATCDLRGVTILVVDDDADNRELLAFGLALFGAKVLLAESAASALNLLAQAPDVLVSDIGMPGEDGYTLVRQVRAARHERQRNMPAIAFTTYARPQDSLRAGFNLHLSKPLSPCSVAEAVFRLVRVNDGAECDGTPREGST